MSSEGCKVVLDQLVSKYKLGSMAYYYKDTGNIDNENAISSIILGNSLLTANGKPVAGEYEIKNMQAMKIMDSFRAGGSFTEYYAMDFASDVMLMDMMNQVISPLPKEKQKSTPFMSIMAK